MFNCNYCKYSDRKSTDEPCLTCQKEKAAWAYFTLKEPEESTEPVIQGIKTIISECEEFQESGESMHRREQAKITAYEEIKDLILRREESEEQA